MQECEGTDPVDDGGNQHAKQNGALNALLCHCNDCKQADEHGDNRQNHLRVTGITHIGLQDTGGQRAEEVTHHIERSRKSVALCIDANVGAQANVHQHQADGGRNAKTDAQRNGIHNLLTNIKSRQNNEQQPFNQNDDQGSLERSNIGHAGDADDVGNNHGKEAVQAHTGSHCKGLICQKCHAEHTDCRSNTGCHEDTVPQGAARSKTGQQVGIQCDDVGHGHECGQAGDHLSFNVGFVLREFKHFFEHGFRPLSPLFLDKNILTLW